MTNETPAAPAGWYPAAHAGNELRYWDGTGWLDIAPPPGGPTAQPTYSAGATPRPQNTDSRYAGMGEAIALKKRSFAGSR